MRTGSWRCPSSPLPPLHPLELRGLVQLHHTVDLSIRVGMILPREDFLTIHVHSGDTTELRFGRWNGDPASAVHSSIELRLSNPAFFDTLLDVGAEILVVGISWSVIFVQSRLEIFARGPVAQLD